MYYGTKRILVEKFEPNLKNGRNFNLAMDCGNIEGRNNTVRNIQNLMLHFNPANAHRHNSKTYEGLLFMAFIVLIILAAFMRSKFGEMQVWINCRSIYSSKFLNNRSGCIGIKEFDLGCIVSFGAFIVFNMVLRRL